MLNLTALYDSLPSLNPTGNEKARFTTCVLPTLERYRLAKDSHDKPAILILMDDLRRKGRIASIVLENLTVQHEVNCRILGASGTENGCFTIIQCTSSESVLRKYFLNLTLPLILSLGNTPSRQSISTAIKRLVELFHAFTQAPQKTTQGLWAELCLIAESQNPTKLARAWHPLPESRYDFSSGIQLLEVKSATGRARQHHFTLEQLCPPASTNLIIASLLVERSDAGTSIAELVELIRSRLGNDPELVSHVDRVIALTLGSSWRNAMEERFDIKIAEKFLAFFAANNIPKVTPDNLPPEVSGVHFKSDLSAVKPLTSAYLRTAGELFRAALRR